MISINDLVSPMNGLVAALLRSPLHFVASKGLMIVRWSGRQSGAEFAIPVGYQRAGDIVTVLLSKPREKNWWKNFRAPWPAELLIQRHWRSAMGQWIEPGSEDFYAPIESTLRRLPWMASQFGGFDFDRDAGLGDAEKEILRDATGVIRFELID